MATPEASSSSAAIFRGFAFWNQGSRGGHDLLSCLSRPSRVQHSRYDIMSRSGCLATTLCNTHFQRVPHAAARSRVLVGRILEVCQNRLHSVFANNVKDSAAESQLNRRWSTLGRNGDPRGFIIGVCRHFLRFRHLEPRI
jgi:hypothetical protein